MYRGRRVRLSGYLRVENVTGTGADIWLRGDAPTMVRAFDRMDDRKRTGTGGWQLAQVVLDLPDDVVGIRFGAGLWGPGKVWVDDLRLDVVDASIPVTAAPFDLPITTRDSAEVVAEYEGLATTPVNLDFEDLVTQSSGTAAAPRIVLSAMTTSRHSLDRR
jgi:hypothetical protein